MKCLNLEKNLITTYVIYLSLSSHGSESASYLGPKIWELIPPVIRQIESFNGFKKKNLKNGNQLIAHVGFPNLHTQRRFLTESNEITPLHLSFLVCTVYL